MAQPRQKGSQPGTKKRRRGRAQKGSSSRSPTKKIDIGILTIRDDEFEAVLNAFPEKDGVLKKSREYTVRWADAGGGQRYRLAIVRQLEQGNGEAQDAARDLIADLKPSLLLVVGIAGGLPSDDFTLGDVVLSTRINDYSVEARKEGAEPTYNLSGGPIAKKIAAGIANLAGRSDELGDWGLGLPARPAVTWTKKGQLCGPAEWQAELRKKLELHFGPSAKGRPPRYIAGPIASSDRLVKDPVVLLPWGQTARHLLAVEMESAGAYRAARERSPLLAIRGISDIVGLKRSNDWTQYACATAAAFTRAYLRTTPVAPRSPRVTTAGSSSAESEGEGQPASAAPEILFANLVPLRSFPETIYIAPAKYDSVRQNWAVLRKGADARVTEAWLLHNKNIYSFCDPSTCRLNLIADVDAVEAHRASDWAGSSDPARHRLFTHLLNGALRDDLDSVGVCFVWQDEMVAFACKLGQKPREVEYRNLRQRSTITVVKEYETKMKDGTVVPYLRHTAFRGRFRLYDDTWYLEVTPTYRFTSDGKKKYRFHESLLKGIKRLEKNRSVLSQVLLWSAVLQGQVGRTENTRPPLLAFNEPPSFPVDAALAESEWLAMDEGGAPSGGAPAEAGVQEVDA